MPRTYPLAPLFLCPLAFGCHRDTGPAWAGLRWNQMQVIGSHNSYKKPIEPPLLERMIEQSAGAASLDYAHVSLSDQLDLGLRSLELDVVHDPEGGRYARPLGLRILAESGHIPESYDPQGVMARPGFKVLHIPDFDFRSHNLTLLDALDELRRWSQGNPRHLPIVITMNAKDSGSQRPGAVTPLRFDSAAYDALDAELLRGLGRERIVTPDDIRGNRLTLEAAVRTDGWPSLDRVRGRFLFVLDESGSKREAYMAGHPSLRGRVLFVTVEPGHPSSAVLIMNDPIRDAERIRQRVEQGYLVRTRADAGTTEARRNDRSRFEAARASGAQIISTDYYLPDKRLSSDYQIRFASGSYVRRNPVTAR